VLFNFTRQATLSLREQRASGPVPGVGEYFRTKEKPLRPGTKGGGLSKTSELTNVVGRDRRDEPCRSKESRKQSTVNEAVFEIEDKGGRELLTKRHKGAAVSRKRDERERHHKRKARGAWGEGIRGTFQETDRERGPSKEVKGLIEEGINERGGGKGKSDDSIGTNLGEN